MPQVSISDAFVPDVTVDEMFQNLTRHVAGEKGIRIERPAPDTLVIHHRYVPGWAIILGILGLLFFLLGLLFFLVKTTETVTVLGRDVDGGARFTATGSSSLQVDAALRLRLLSPPATRWCPSCGASMGRSASVCPSCGEVSSPEFDHAGVRWSQGAAGEWQWFDRDIYAWRWYKDGTLSTDLSEVPRRFRRRADKPSKEIDPQSVSPPSLPQIKSPAPVDETKHSPEIPSAESPALAAEIERLADLHARGILTDNEFQEAKQRVLRA